MARGNTDANGFNWNADTQECRGVKDAHVIDTKQTKWKTCIFSGKATIEKLTFLYNSFVLLYQYKSKICFLKNYQDPCVQGYEYEKGTSVKGLLNETSDKDNPQCAILCDKNDNCSSYEHTSYGKKCKLFSIDHVEDDHRSGYIHCNRLGIV